MPCLRDLGGQDRGNALKHRIVYTAEGRAGGPQLAVLAIQCAAMPRFVLVLLLVIDLWAGGTQLADREHEREHECRFAHSFLRFT